MRLDAPEILNHGTTCWHLVLTLQDNPLGHAVSTKLIRASLDAVTQLTIYRI